MIGKAIHARLTSDPAVSAIIAGRVFPHMATGTYPAVVYAEDTAEYPRHYTGSDGYTRTTAEIGCLARSYGAAIDLAAAVRAALDNKAGTWGGIDVQGCFLQDETDDIIRDPNVAENRYYLRQQSYLVVYRQ
jgi:hypothetical protein